MNKYGAIAEQHWKKVARVRYETLENPTSFFTDLGEQVQAQVEATLEKLETTIDPDLPYLEKVGTLNAMRKQAEEIALEDLVYGTPIEHSLEEELETMLNGLPGESTLQDSLHLLKTQAEEEGWTEETQARYNQLSDLLPLVTEQSGHRRDELDQLTEAETRDWILKLRPFWDPQTQTLTRLS